MKICHILQSVNNMSAGPTYSVGLVAEALYDLQQDVKVCAFGVKPDSWPFRVKLDNIYNKAEAIGLLGLESINLIKKSGREADIIHCHGVWRSSNLFTYFLPKHYKSKIVWSPRGMFSDWSWNHHSLIKKPFWAFLQKRAIAKTDCYHATADSEYIDIRKRGLMQPVAVIPNGVFVPELGKVSKKREVVFLSRIHKKKGLELLLDAWQKLQSIHGDWSVKIAGPLDSAYAEEIQGYAADKDLKNVEFIGEVLGYEKEKLLSEASLFVLPSYSENFGIAIAESLAHGTPVVTTTETPWEGMHAHNCGWWVKPDGIEIENAMSIALSLSLDELKEKGLNGRLWMKEEFSWEAIAHSMHQLYKWLSGAADKPAFIKEN